MIGSQASAISMTPAPCLLPVATLSRNDGRPPRVALFEWHAMTHHTYVEMHR